MSAPLDDLIMEGLSPGYLRERDRLISGFCDVVGDERGRPAAPMMVALGIFSGCWLAGVATYPGNSLKLEFLYRTFCDGVRKVALECVGIAVPQGPAIANTLQYRDKLFADLVELLPTEWLPERDRLLKGFAEVVGDDDGLAAPQMEAIVTFAGRWLADVTTTPGNNLGFEFHYRTFCEGARKVADAEMAKASATPPSKPPPWIH